MAYSSASNDLVTFFDDLVRCETRLYNAVNETLRLQHGMAASQFEMLRYLAARPGARVIEIAENFAAGVGAISKGVDRLVDRGWARRHPNPSDGRSSLVSLTAEGERLVADAEAAFRAQLAALIPLPHDRLEAVMTALSDLRASLEESKAGIPVG
ncbi:MarR family transcriptional regulator [Leifsonia sp. fls2-241-R2A-40a]|uniref:MarR family winged helix-turn-helix transcriptional regulator n=1 Tax=Leifsonia sp. fls2-241-R2A-40a TaxID=3040290 RepID=UPI002550197F|nr:MarR family transcriptional regulator [Leifsonia sp. fls2-241-R2A-40a]